MTHEMAGRKQTGRPPRAPGEKLQRVALNLRPSLLFGLEMLARTRRTSLSQAAEYAIAVVVQEHGLDAYARGDADAEWARIPGTGELTKNFIERLRHLTENFDDERRNTPAGRALFMPRALRLPMEDVFLATLAMVDIGPEQLDELFEFCRAGFETGATTNALVDQWLARHAPKRTARAPTAKK